MAVIFNEKGVKDCRPPCVAQSFINHNAILYKIYLVGDEYFVVDRPSLKNFYPSGKSSTYTIKIVSEVEMPYSCCIILQAIKCLLKTFRPDWKFIILSMKPGQFAIIFSCIFLTHVTELTDCRVSCVKWGLP